MMTAARLELPQVTLCAVTSVNVHATLCALEACLDQVSFAACKLLTDAAVQPEHPAIEVVPIMRLETAAAYSDFMLGQLVKHVATSHCLVVQWDGHLLDASRWQSEFLRYDYIGASWPQFKDGHDVGNGGFSLRSRSLMEACRSPCFQASHPEDLAIGRVNRAWLESLGLRFASRDVADLFAAERAGFLPGCFGYHGVFNMPRAIGTERFWNVYRRLDEYSTLRHDWLRLALDMLRSPRGGCRAARIAWDRLRR